MDQLKKCLPDKHEDLTSDLQHPSKKQCAPAHCNPRAGKAERGSPWSLLDNLSTHIPKTQVQVSKTKVKDRQGGLAGKHL